MTTDQHITNQYIRDQFESDQAAEDERMTLPHFTVYQHSDGERFRVAEIHAEGIVIADSGRRMRAREFLECKEVSSEH